ncbi:MAG: glycosyltransferase family 39 protein [Ardenticatenaceae bacterium]|nr:glycosyltransferase family 39 protein [Ardenticatenaceae bacterium]
MSSPNRSITRSLRPWLGSGPAVLILILAPLTFATSVALWPRLVALLLLAWALPGVLLLALWRVPALDTITAGLLAAGLGWCWLLLVALLVHWVPGPIGLWPLVAAYELGAAALLLALRWRRPLPPVPSGPVAWRHLALLLVTAGALRLPGLGYHEFHFDEVLVLTRAREAIRGEDDALARHAKGPGEIAVSLAVYRALGTTNETSARLPFALASIASVLATAAVGRRLFSPVVGVWAGLLLAANGYALGLSRLVQYQPAVLLLMALAFLAAWEFAQRGSARWLLLAAVFSAFGLVMHYEFGLLAPVLVVLAWIGWRRAPGRTTLRAALVAGTAGGALVAATYLPLVLHPYFASTQQYLGIRAGRPGTFNGAFFVEMGTFYNSIFFFVGLLLLVVAGLVVGWRWARGTTLLLALWFLPFFIVYLFVMQFPGTHFYLLMESWSLLAALPVAALTEARGRPMVHWGARAVLAGWLALSVGYLYLMFFRQVPEYLVNFQHERLPLYWAPYGANVPEKPRFGFPIFEGWKALGVLSEWHYLDGTYASNERSRHLRWYLGDFDRVGFDEHPDFIFVATHLQEPDPDFNPGRLEGYRQVGEVRVRGEPRIALFARQPLVVPYVSYDAEPFVPIFDTVVPPLQEWPAPPARALDASLGGVVVLERVSPATVALRPGETLHLVLYWRAERPPDRDYKVFVHLGDGQPRAQWDGFPGLNTARTGRWPVGKRFEDHVLLRVPPGPAAIYPLIVGLYDPTSRERLGGQALTVGTVTVR